MFHFQIRTLTALGVALLLAGSIAEAQKKPEKKKLSKADKLWLEEEVAALVTKEEIEIFEMLSDKDRQDFKERFWARRDFNPMTPQNEFKDEFLSRMTAADRNFKSRGTRGAATDQGKVFLLLGPPSQRTGSRESGGAAPSGGAGGGAPSPAGGGGEEGPGPGGAGPDLGSEAEGGGGQTVTWVYAPSSERGIPQGLSVQFRSSGGFGLRLSSGKDVEAALEQVKGRYIYNPNINYNRDEKGRLIPIADHASDPNSPAKKILQALVESKTATPDVDFKMSNMFFRAAGGQIYIPMLFNIDGSKLTWGGELAEATVFGRVQNEQDQMVYQYEEPAKLAKEGDRAFFEMPLQLQPGKYTLYLGVRDNKSSAAGTQIVPLEVPDYGKEFVMSTVLLYSQGQQVSEAAGSPGHAFQFGQVHFKPKRDLSYKKSDTMSAFFFIYGYAVDEAAGNKPNVTCQYVFYKDGTRKGQTKEEPLQANELQGIGNAEIPLGSFEPGSYKMEIRVTDQVSKKTLKQEVSFTVVEGS